MFCVAADFDQLVALFVDKQLALDAFKALTAQTPYAIMAISTRSSLKEKKVFQLEYQSSLWQDILLLVTYPVETFSLKKMTIDSVKFSPPPSTTSVNALVFT